MPQTLKLTRPMDEIIIKTSQVWLCKQQSWSV